MCKDIITEEHHRRARSLGGSEKPSNISNVEAVKHRAWHTLFGNLNAYQTCKRINELIYKPSNVNVICKFINGSEVVGSGKYYSKKRGKVSSAWETLFSNLEFDEVIKYINNVWLDPSYHLYIEELKS